jgi:hypothetical protein
LFDDFLPSFLPDWITGSPGIFAAICGTSSSIALNLMSVNNTTLRDTPMQHLDKKAVPPLQADQDVEELRPWGAAPKSSNKGPGLWGSVPSLKVNTTLRGSNKSVGKGDEGYVPLVDSSTPDDNRSSMRGDSALHIAYAVYEEHIEQLSYQCR